MKEQLQKNLSTLSTTFQEVLILSKLESKFQLKVIEIKEAAEKKSVNWKCNYRKMQQLENAHQ